MAAPELIQGLYASLAWLQGSIVPLVAIALALGLLVTFAAREFLAWFFKVQSLREEVRSLEALNLEILGEIRALRSEIQSSGGLFTEDARIIERPTPKSSGPKSSGPVATGTPPRQSAGLFSQPLQGQTIAQRSSSVDLRSMGPI